MIRNAQSTATKLVNSRRIGWNILSPLPEIPPCRDIIPHLVCSLCRFIFQFSVFCIHVCIFPGTQMGRNYFKFQNTDVMSFFLSALKFSQNVIFSFSLQEIFPVQVIRGHSCSSLLRQKKASCVRSGESGQPI